MTPPRIVTVLATLAAAAAGALTLMPSSAPAAPPATGWHGRVHLSDKPRVGQAQIVGVVTDEAARAVDNISVVAWPVVGGVRGKTPAASDLTYQGPGHRHGFYRLQVPAGTYVVTYASGPHSRTLYRPQTGHKVLAASQHVVTLTTVQMRLRTPSTSTVALSVDRAAANSSKRGHASVVVSSKDVKWALGTVQVAEVVGKHRHAHLVTLVTGHLVLTSHGHLALRLPRLADGKHVLVASYLGAQNLKPSTDRLVVTVH